MADYLAGRYALYKDGTSRIVRFLRTAARDLPATVITAQKGSFSAQDLAKFATAIASAHPAVHISGTLLELVAEVITGREVCADWYGAQAAASESNKTHRHFIDVLRSVYNVLKQARQVQKVSTAREHSTFRDVRPVTQEEEPPMPDKVDLHNLFAQLDIEESSDSPSSSEPSLAQDSQFKRHAKTEQISETDDHVEQEFALWCFLQDCREMRIYVGDVWQRFRAGQLSFLAATAVSNNAFGIMRRADKELATAYSDFIDYDQVLSFLGLTIRHNDKGPFLAAPCHEEFAETDTRANHLLCPEAALVLGLFKNAEMAQPLHEKETPFEENCDATAAARQPNATASNEPRIITEESDTFKPFLVEADNAAWKATSYHPFATELVRISWEIRTLACHHDDDSSKRVSDEFLDAFGQLGKSHQLRLWHIVACQMYMDAYQVVSEMARQGLTDLREMATSANSTIDRLAEFAGVPDPINWRTVIEYLREQVTLSKTPTLALEVDDLLEYQMSTGTLVSSFHGSEWLPSATLKALPNFSGFQLCYHTMTFYLTGMKLANRRHVVVAMAHLYAAMKHYGLLNSTWIDMDWFISGQSKQRPFMAALPGKIGRKALLRRFPMALGFPADTFCSPGSIGLCPAASSRYSHTKITSQLRGTFHMLHGRRTFAH